MRQTGQTMAMGWAEDKSGRVERTRVEKVMETLATLRNRGESLSEVAHDARNMVTALGLYCDLLEEPGVLATPYAHYGHELRLVAAASRRLVEKMVALDAQTAQAAIPPAGSKLDAGPLTAGVTVNSGTGPGVDRRPRSNPNANRQWDLVPSVAVADLAGELISNRNVLSALAGPSVRLEVNTDGGEQPVRLTGEDLTRVLVNLVKNGAEAMPDGGEIQISLREGSATKGAAACLTLTVEDSGQGIPAEALEKIFHSGYSTKGKNEPRSAWPVSHRGLGLAIARSIVEAAGGRILAGNREQGGARIEIELPVRKATV